MPKKGKPKAKPQRQVDTARREAEVPPHRQLYVGNLPADDTTDESLKELFSAAGEVEAADVHRTAKHCFGFVTFRTVAEATSAVELLHGKDGMTVKFSSNPVPEVSQPPVRETKTEEVESDGGDEGDAAQEAERDCGGVPRAVLLRDYPQPVESLQDLVQKAIRTTSTRDSILYTIAECEGQFVGTVKIVVPDGEVSQKSDPQPSKKEARRAVALAALRCAEVHRLLPPLPAKVKQADEAAVDLHAESHDEDDSSEAGSEGSAAVVARGEQDDNDEDDDEEDEDDDDDENKDDEDEDDEDEDDEEDEEEDEEEDSEDDEAVPVLASKLRTARWPVAGQEVAVVTGGVAPNVKDVPGGAVAALRVSPDAVAVLRWLDEAVDSDALAPDPALFVELGCGVGLLGLACAALRPRSRVVLTDIKAVLPYAERSIAANSKAIGSRVVTRKLRFGEEGAVRALLAEFGGAGRPVAIGAAISYWECVYEPLTATLRELCDAGGEGIIGYFRRDWKVERRFWTKLLPNSGLAAEVVWEGEVEPPEDAVSCAPVCTRTPGEWNARVYRVTKSAASSFEPPARQPFEEAAPPAPGKKTSLDLKKEREQRALETHRQQQEARQAKLASRKKKFCRDTKLREKQSAKHEKGGEVEPSG